MRGLQITAGVVFLLLALFAGGCSVVWTGLFVVDSGFLVVWPITLGGYLLAAATGPLGWWALRGGGASAATAPPRDDGG